MAVARGRVNEDGASLSVASAVRNGNQTQRFTTFLQRSDRLVHRHGAHLSPFKRGDPARVAGAIVTFEPGTRIPWSDLDRDSGLRTQACRLKKSRRRHTSPPSIVPPLIGQRLGLIGFFYFPNGGWPFLSGKYWCNAARLASGTSSSQASSGLISATDLDVRKRSVTICCGFTGNL